MRWVAGLWLMAWAMAADAGEPSGARAFMQGALAFALHGDVDPRSPAYLRFFTKPLADAMLLDGSQSDIGVIEAEVLCQCQDNGGLKARVQQVAPVGADVAVRVHYSADGDWRHDATFILHQENRQWRIADIWDDGTAKSSLFKALEISNRERFGGSRKRR
ncbi:hypothetical protein [Novosphingobium sp. KACC 22771]|uniref:hypothetical protein n=1 Tax=Novosphingobium sp. KACC 22771 TaxID=3025670 RepID=UPI00236666B3|nr:hypothetical protein [Novosphingobium sp. KACC 22771]WDF72022.1 hypothetical protein PQ467_14665 [Novosphingobium sp. KACC 22771]